MRYKNWKMRQVSSVLVINPFLLNVLTLPILKTTLCDTLRHTSQVLYLYNGNTFLNFVLFFFSPSSVLILIISVVFEYCHASEE